MSEEYVVPRRRRWVAPAAALIVLTGALLAGCASAEDDSSPADPATSQESTPTDGGTGSPSAEPQGTVVDITFSGDSVTPNGERIDAEVGEPLTLDITADKPGELHVHSTPEQEVAYDAGTSTHQVTFDQPGIVDIESHHLDKVVVQVEVR
ncbi:hypothetical protein EKO23_18205 [Nocardioides guangzhouensis]|uniref:EfeO-type cupredoxin-like domain-containing protein n=1 Tax=Nocardioides guangzhouensis TaxID=2497878 RepID=A0A4Q4Z776_9ACTN|nr:hypothetical protein [Nocardioides guangzhouensis]RYP83690.1 hypothetical protein EKO23_18205 [Nocardioides guangzhouensis]